MKNPAIISTLLLIFIVFSEAHDSALRPVGLQCEYRTDPLGIDVRQPRLFWTLESAADERGKLQSAYRVLVATSAEKLAADQGDLWDSGKVTTNRQLHIEYSGQPLQSGMQCYWKVRVWDEEDNVSGWSTPASWTMGMLDRTDWQGHWIGATDLLLNNTSNPVYGYHAREAATPDEIKWVQVDLGNEYPVEQVILHSPLPSGYEEVVGFGFPVRFHIEASLDPEFSQPQVIADFTSQDYQEPESQRHIFTANQINARYIRVTATRLWDRGTGSAPYCFALAEIEVLSQDENVALNTTAQAKDSVEAYGWSMQQVTDGKYLLTADDPAVATHPRNAAILLRKEVEVTQEIRRATLFLCGLGYCELRMNGHKIGNAVLDPGFTDFSKRILYRTVDVTDVLESGPNALGVMLGGGWFNLATPDMFGFERAPWSATPRMLLQMNIEYANGQTQTVVSDGTWKWSTGEITFNCVRGGETIDARCKKEGWSSAGYDDADWSAVVSLNQPDGELGSRQCPAIHVTDTIRPVKLTEPEPGVFVFDLGVNIAGWARLETQGPRGTEVKLEYNELLNSDGTVNTEYNTSHTFGRFQTEEFVLKGEGIETFEPRFTYHGFRYVQVTGLAQEPSLESLTGCWVTTDPKPAGHFSCSNERVNKIQELIMRTLLNNMHSIPTDCPQREKMGWLNDGCVCMETAFYNLDTPLFYQKWFNDMIDSQEANGHVPSIVPTCGWAQSNPDGSVVRWSDPWWGGSIVLAPWKLYQHYGDVQVLEQGYPHMKAYVDYLSSTAEGDCIEWGLGDWLDETAGGDRRRAPVPLTSTAAYAEQARIVSRTAEMLGKEDEAQQYEELADNAAAAYNQRFLDTETGLYALDSQTAQALSLSLNLTPPEQQQQVFSQLVDNIAIERNGHVGTGIVGTLFLFKALMENNRDDLAYLMLTQEDYPGWLHMVNQGGTALWEAWNGQNSRNHPTFGCVGFWLYEGLGGIRPDLTEPGFKKIIIKPAIVGELQWVSCSYPSMYGEIVSDWERQADHLTLSITIPANTTATVYMPTDNPDSVTESGNPADEARGVSFLHSDERWAVYSVGSGSYHFESLLVD